MFTGSPNLIPQPPPIPKSNCKPTCKLQTKCNPSPEPVVFYEIKHLSFMHLLDHLLILYRENRSPVSQRMTFDLAEYYQLVLGVERIRVAEALFQPSIMGLEQGGLAETMEYVLRQYEPQAQDKLVQVRRYVVHFYASATK